MEVLRGELCRKEEECRERERRLAALEQEVQEKTGLVVQLQQQLEAAAQHRQQLQRQLEETSMHRSQNEEQLASRLHDAEEALSHQAALPPQVKVRTGGYRDVSMDCTTTICFKTIY